MWIKVCNPMEIDWFWEKIVFCFRCQRSREQCTFLWDWGLVLWWDTWAITAISFVWPPAPKGMFGRPYVSYYWLTIPNIAFTYLKNHMLGLMKLHLLKSMFRINPTRQHCTYICYIHVILRYILWLVPESYRKCIFSQKFSHRIFLFKILS